MNTLTEKGISLVLLAIILAGVGMRFLPFEGNMGNEDEWYNAISAVKFATGHSTYDVRAYNYEQPPLGKWILGWGVDTNRAYPNTQHILSNVYYYNYLAVREIEDQLPRMKLIVALFSALALVPLFFLAKKLTHSTKSALWASTLMAIGAGFVNQGRILTQDGIFPFFFLLATWAVIEYGARVQQKFNETTTTFWRTHAAGIGVIATLSLAALVRVGQPIVLAGSTVVAAAMSGRRRVETGILLAITTMIAVLVYSPHALFLLIQNRSGNVVPITMNTSFILGFVSQNSYALAGMLATLIIGGIIHASKQKNVFSLEKWRTISPEWKMAGIIFGLSLLAMVFTEAGTQPRYYLVFFALPLMGVAHLFERHAPRLAKWGVLVLLVLDAGMVFANAGTLPHYTIGGIEPVYFKTPTTFAQTEGFISGNQISTFYTNDVWMMARHPEARPMPPLSKLFTETHDCTPDYYRGMVHAVIVYHKSSEDWLRNDKYLCPLSKKLEFVLFGAFPSIENSEYRVYGVVSYDENGN